tara:strand:+ start:306 stop:530 length:225 start_codon:yes stop_codon:yes gene_type:complete
MLSASAENLSRAPAGERTPVQFGCMILSIKDRVGLDGFISSRIYPINGKVGTGWYSSPAGYIPLWESLAERRVL